MNAQLIKFRCSSCNQLFGISQEKAGQQVTCPKCHAATRVPNAVAAPVNRVAAAVGQATSSQPAPPPPLVEDFKVETNGHGPAHRLSPWSRVKIEHWPQFRQALIDRKPTAIAAAVAAALALILFFVVVINLMTPNVEVQQVRDKHTGKVVSRRHVYEDGDGNFLKHGPEIEWYNNGQKKTEVNYSHGKRHGVATEWYKDGQKKTEVAHHHDVLDGPIRQWHETGIPSLEGYYRDEKRHGTWKYYGWEGNLTKQEEYKDGVSHGEWIATDKEGKKSSQLYVDGKKHGPYTSWYSNGKKLEEGLYENDLKVGRWTKWHPNGAKEAEGDIVNDLQEGMWSFWHDNEQLAMNMEYRQGKEWGLWPSWDRSGKKLPLLKTITIESTRDKFVKVIAFSPDDRELAAAVPSDAGHVYIWDLRSGQQAAVLSESAWTQHVAYAPDGRYLAATNNNTSVTFWDTTTREKKRVVTALTTVARRIYYPQFNPQGDTFAAISTNSGNWATVFSLWDTASGTQKRVIELEKGFSQFGGGTGISSFAFDKEGERIVYGTQAGMVGLWKLTDAKEEPVHDYSPYAPAAVTFMGRDTLAIFCVPQKHWTGNPPKDVPASLSLLVGEGNAYQVKTSWKLPPIRYPAVFDAAGDRLAATTEDSIELFDVRTGRKLARLEKAHSTKRVTTLTFSHDGKYLASFGSDYSLKIWDVSDIR